MPPVALTQIHFFTRTRSSIFLRQECRRNASVGAISLFLRKPSSLVALVSSQKSTAGLLAYQLSPRLTVVWMALTVVRHSRDRCARGFARALSNPAAKMEFVSDRSLQQH